MKKLMDEPQQNTTLRRAVFLSALLVMSCAGRHGYRTEPGYPKIKHPLVRVKLMETDQAIVISPLPHEEYALRAIQRGQAAKTYRSQSDARICSVDNLIILSVNERQTGDKGFRQVSISPLDSRSSLLLNGKPYRGALEVLPLPPGRSEGDSATLVVLNVVSVEDYLKGVVPAEIGSLSEREFEALKAQAVAARTYALSHIGQYKESGYDLAASVTDQVYLGVEGENSLVNRAIRETKGIVLTWKGNPIDAYYHANCGGRTEYIERVWDKDPEPYLVPVEDHSCGWAESYEWVETWSGTEIKDNLTAYIDTLVALQSDTLARLTDLRIKMRSPSGRVEVLEVVTDFAVYDINSDHIRWALRRGGRPDLILRSTLFDLELARGSDGSVVRVTAHGHGTGHGVGACQTGMIGMAREGYRFDQILRHYYTGAQLKPWKDRSGSF